MENALVELDPVVVPPHHGLQDDGDGECAIVDVGNVPDGVADPHGRVVRGWQVPVVPGREDNGLGAPGVPL